MKSYKKVLILGSGALKIGEAGEFDYSGTQALKALKEEGIETVLVNPNIATVQTSENVVDKVYFYPVTPYFARKVIEKEKPDCILLSFGGQTALNCGLELFLNGTLREFNVDVLGTSPETIMLTEDRKKFAEFLREKGIKTPESKAAKTVEEAVEIGKKLGFPLIVRAGFALGGLGSGFCENEKELEKLAEHALSLTDHILVEESIKGWKEIEYEIVRDRFGNCIAVCNMENFDPLGIHTGESIVVAPSQTLTNEEYYRLRDIAVSIVKDANIVGECNVQFALNPQTGDYRVIELNPRLSRSSALASKATGYPLAFVAAKLALGYGLFELKNAVTGVTSAFFEPSLDYVVVKIPRWDLLKFKGVEREIGSSMKSVGEVMAIGRSFEEAIQKGLRMVENGAIGFVGNKNFSFKNIEESLKTPTDTRIFAIEKAFEKGFSVDKIHQLTKIDKWFLFCLEKIYKISLELKKYEKAEDIPYELLKKAKQNGFSDYQIALFVYPDFTGSKLKEKEKEVRKHRKSLGITPFVKRIDTTAGEIPAITNYLYLTYHGESHDISFESKSPKAAVLGSGSYRIGSSVEFDWCAVNAVNSASRCGFETIMINCNPETVSTDYDICDKLYFEEITFERILDIAELEKPDKVILSNGGQIANNLAVPLYSEGIKVAGVSPLSIDTAENRHKFSSLLDSLGIDQPKWKELSSLDDVKAFARETGFPLLIRPSYVLSGAAMNVVSNEEQLVNFLKIASNVSPEHPVVVSEFIEHAKEIEIDAVADNGEIIVYAISEHVEFAGVHSGDATIVFPAQKLYLETVRRIKKIARKIAQALKITGPFNIQFLAKDNDIKVIECNLRASRSFPFVSKTLKINFIDIATKLQLGLKVKKPEKSAFELDYVGVKAPQFSFARLKGADPVLGVDMVSTGEVGCFGEDFYQALLISMLSVGFKIPEKGVLFSAGTSYSKVELLDSVKLLFEKGIKIYATPESHEFFKTNGIDSELVFCPISGKSPDASEIIKSGKVELVVNIPKQTSENKVSDDFAIRRAAVDFGVSLITNSKVASSFITAFCKKELKTIPLKHYGEFI